MIKEIDGFKFQLGIDGSKKLIIESYKLDACIKYVLEGNIKAITINYFNWYELSDINFLSSLSNVIEGLHLPETKFNNLVINTLHKLKYLGFADNKKDKIDLSNFPNLESLACDYSIRLKNLEAYKNLKYLTLTGYKSKSKDLSDLPLFENLLELSLFKPDITSLNGIERFSNLEKLEIYRGSKLETISSIRTLSNNLSEIQVIQSKRIKDMEIIGELQSLKKIILSESGEIKSLAFIKRLPLLEFISF